MIQRYQTGQNAHADPGLPTMGTRASEADYGRMADSFGDFHCLFNHMNTWVHKDHLTREEKATG